MQPRDGSCGSTKSLAQFVAQRCKLTGVAGREGEVATARPTESPVSPWANDRRKTGRRLEDRLERMRDASNLAVHELRAPLTVAYGYASMILDGSLGPGSDLWTTAVEEVAEKLVAANVLVDNLLLLARVSDESAVPLENDLDLVAVARAAGARAKSRVDQLGGTLTIEAEEAEVHAVGDYVMVATVVDNLLNNAFLYGGKAPDVTVHVGRSPGPGISVTDHGRGIAPEAKDRVFERFFRVVDHSPEPGSGLGLYLSAELARRQGGTVTLDWSEVGQGSTFSLRLPTFESRLAR